MGHDDESSDSDQLTGATCLDFASCSGFDISGWWALGLVIAVPFVMASLAYGIYLIWERRKNNSINNSNNPPNDKPNKTPNKHKDNKTNDKVIASNLRRAGASPPVKQYSKSPNKVYKDKNQKTVQTRNNDKSSSKKLKYQEKSSRKQQKPSYPHARVQPLPRLSQANRITPVQRESAKTSES